MAPWKTTERFFHRCGRNAFSPPWSTSSPAIRMLPETVALGGRDYLEIDFNNVDYTK